MKKVLDLACGKRKRKGAIGIDIRKFKDVDIILNLGWDKLPFINDSIDEIYAEQIFEHLGYHKQHDEFLHCLNECWRILKPNGFLYFVVPCFPSSSSVNHPDHKRFFTKDSFAFYQVPAGNTDPHGYLNGKFWHICIDEELTNKDMICGKMYPNKKNGRFIWKEIKND